MVKRARKHDRSWLGTMGRRAVTVPSYMLLAALCLITAPLWLVTTVLLDMASSKRGLFPRTRAGGFIALYLCCEVLGIIAAACIGALSLGGLLWGHTRYRRANAALQRWWTSALFRGGTSLFGMTTVVENAQVASRGPFLLFVRHSSTADTVLAAALVANPHRLLLRYVIKRELLWDPCLDIVGGRLPNAFIDRNADRKDSDVAAMMQLATKLDERSAVLIYPEGTRFSKAKQQRAIASLRDSGETALAEIATTFRNVLPPRRRGALALLEAAPDVDVVFLEHTGFEGATTLGSFLDGKLVGRTLRVRLRRFEARSIPTEARDTWLFERWREMDDWIDGLASTKEDTT